MIELIFCSFILKLLFPYFLILHSNSRNGLPDICAIHKCNWLGRFIIIYSHLALDLNSELKLVLCFLNLPISSQNNP